MNRDAYQELREATEPQIVGSMTRYLRRLIVEQPYIRARLENPGGSVVLMPSSTDQVSYNPNIGNDAHLDLITADIVLEREFSQGERDTIEEWALGHTSQQAAEYNSVKPGAIRKRRERVLDKLEQRLNDERGFDIGGSGDRPAEGSGEAGEHVATQAGHPRPATDQVGEQEGSQSGRTVGKEAA